MVLEKILDAALVDVDRYNKKDKNHTMEICSALTAVRKIAEKGILIDSKPKVKQVIISKYFNSYKIFRKVHQDEEILKMMTAFIKNNGIT